MILGRKLKLGRKISEIAIGEKFTLTETISDQDLLLYLGLTDDANPLFIQHDYASQTSFKKPVVPPIMILGIIISSISKYFPGPGSYVKQQAIEFISPLYHYEAIQLLFEVINREVHSNTVKIQVVGHNEKGEKILEGTVSVCPPESMGGLDGSILENF